MIEVPPIGSRWQECDKRFTRIIEVIPGFDEVQRRVRIKNVKNGRKAWALVHRFDGKSSGYKRIDGDRTP